MLPDCIRLRIIIKIFKILTKGIRFFYNVYIEAIANTYCLYVKISVPFGDDIPVGPVPAFQPYFTKNNLMMAGCRRKVSIFKQPEGSYMGKKDTYTRPFMANKERFAELINVHIYQGKDFVKPEMLKRLRGGYPALSSATGEKVRDILMEQENPRMRYGMELETGIDYGMPERIMLYDAGEYEKQIRERNRDKRSRGEGQSYTEKKSRMEKGERFIPVITIVLYLGEGKWQAPQRMKGMLEIDSEMPECAERFIQDYKIQVVDADFVDPKDYRTDLKEFFMALQCRNNRKKLRALLQSDEFQHLEQETEMAIAVNLNLKPIITKMEEEEISMCKAFEELMIEQEELGMEKGDAVRIIKSVEHVIDNLKVTLAEACGIIGVTPEEFERAKAL